MPIVELAGWDIGTIHTHLGCGDMSTIHRHGHYTQTCVLACGDMSTTHRHVCWPAHNHMEMFKKTPVSSRQQRRTEGGWPVPDSVTGFRGGTYWFPEDMSPSPITDLSESPIADLSTNPIADVSPSPIADMSLSPTYLPRSPMSYYREADSTNQPLSWYP